jgi:hypothetical protein
MEASAEDTVIAGEEGCLDITNLRQGRERSKENLGKQS